MCPQPAHSIRIEGQPEPGMHLGQKADRRDEHEIGALDHLQSGLEHRNSTPGPRFLASNAILNPSFKAPAQWGEDPSETRPMLFFISEVVLGLLKFETRRPHSISIIVCWLR